MKAYGGEFQPEKKHIKNGEEFNSEELSHGGEINSSTSFVGTFLPNGISIAILSNRPNQAAVLEGAMGSYPLQKRVGINVNSTFL